MLSSRVNGDYAMVSANNVPGCLVETGKRITSCGWNGIHLVQEKDCYPVLTLTPSDDGVTPDNHKITFTPTGSSIKVEITNAISETEIANLQSLPKSFGIKGPYYDIIDTKSYYENDDDVSDLPPRYEVKYYNSTKILVTPTKITYQTGSLVQVWKNSGVTFKSAYFANGKYLPQTISCDEISDWEVPLPMKHDRKPSAGSVTVDLS